LSGQTVIDRVIDSDAAEIENFAEDALWSFIVFVETCVWRGNRGKFVEDAQQRLW